MNTIKITMGNLFYKQPPSDVLKTGIDRMKFERVLDGEEMLYIGIASSNLPNPLSSQVIRHGIFGKTRRLENFIEHENGMEYVYEDNVKLFVNKSKDGKVMLNYVSPCENTEIMKPMNETCVKVFKPIQFSTLSKEYDTLEKILGLK